MSQSWIAQIQQEHTEAIQRHQRSVATHQAIIPVLHAYEQQTITEGQASHSLRRRRPQRWSWAW